MHCLLAALGCPLSEHKLKVGAHVTYLGFELDLEMATVGIPAEKAHKSLQFLDSLRAGQYVAKKDLEKGRGRLLWATWVSPALRPWLAPFFQCCTQTCRENRVRISGQLAATCGFWKSALKNFSCLHKCEQRTELGTLGAADACAQGNIASLGGWWCDESDASLHNIKWFRVRLHMEDLPSWMRPQVSAQERIAFWELLAQVILAVLRFRELQNVEGCVSISQSCDNQGAVA